MYNFIAKVNQRSNLSILFYSCQVLWKKIFFVGVIFMPESILYQRIRELCEDRGIQIIRLCADLNISPTSIPKWKSGTSPSIYKIQSIAAYFGVSIDYLIGASNIREPAEQLIGDEDIVSLQRVRSKMSEQDKERMMQLLHIAFNGAFDEVGD